MGTSEDSTPAKSFKPSVSTKVVYLHHFMPQYGPALQYHVLYNKEVNANPNIVRGAGLTIPEKIERIPKIMDLDPKRKRKRSLKNLGFVGNGSGESEKAALRFGNNGPSRSAASGSVCSSDESDDTNQEFSASERQRFNQLLADGVVSQNNATVQYHVPDTDLALQVLVATTSETDLNLRMRLSASSAQTILMKEEHELKKERRKQSNRESASRLRLHRQQECEKLQAVVEILRTESSMLKDELMRLSEDSGNLGDENNSIMDELTKMYGPDAISDLIAMNPDSGCGESNNSKQ